MHHGNAWPHITNVVEYAEKINLKCFSFLFKPRFTSKSSFASTIEK